jgi:hypothetical protein
MTEMKKIYIFLSLILFTFAFISCEKDDPKTTITDVTPSVISNLSSSDFILVKDDASNEFQTFEWTSADYGFSASVTYTLQFAAKDSNFAHPVVIGSVNNANSLSISIGEFNKMLLNYGLNPDEATPLQFRIVAIVSPNYTPSVSNAVEANITPYSTLIVVPPIYLLGDGTNAGWDNNTRIEMKYSSDEEAFVTYDSLKSSGYIKFIRSRGHWAPQWGTDGTGTSSAGPLVYRPTESVPDPNAIPAPSTAGMYKILADTAHLTYKVTPYNIGLVGSATPNAWNAPDSKMSYDNANDVWTITVDLVPGEIKFRMNDAWDWNLGGDINNLTQGGDNIPVAAGGNYTITLILTKEPFKCIITKN